MMGKVVTIMSRNISMNNTRTSTRNSTEVGVGPEAEEEEAQAEEIEGQEEDTTPEEEDMEDSEVTARRKILGR